MNKNKVIGHVKWFRQEKGYGFIRYGGEKDIFFHVRDLPQGIVNVLPEQKVAFFLEQSAKGPRARRLELLPT